MKTSTTKGRVREPSLASSIRDSIKNEIESGRLTPGTPIDERTLASQYSVSRTPVREALQQLAAHDLVQIIPHQGAMVSRLSIPQLRDTLELLGELEALSAKFAARRVSDALRIAIEAALDRGHAAAQSGLSGEYSAANLAFHEVIQSGSRNELLVRQVRPMRRLILRYNTNARLMQTPGRIAKSMQDHRRIADAILGGDEQRAYELMLEHVPAGGSGFSEFISDLPPSFFEPTPING